MVALFRADRPGGYGLASRNVTFILRKVNVRSNGATGVEPRLKALMLDGLKGDRLAYAQLLRELAPFLRGYFRKRLGPSADDAEDLLQETLLAVHVKRDTYDRSLPFSPWVYGIARYKMLDHFRKTGARRPVPLEDAGELFALDNPEEGGVRRDITRLLSGLPARQARLVRDVKLTGFSMEEAAARSDMSVTAVKVGVHRAMQTLMKRVGDGHR